MTRRVKENLLFAPRHVQNLKEKCEGLFFLPFRFFSFCSAFFRLVARCLFLLLGAFLNFLDTFCGLWGALFPPGFRVSSGFSFRDHGLRESLMCVSRPDTSKTL